MDSMTKGFTDIIAEGATPGEALVQLRGRLKGKEAGLEEALRGEHTFFASGLTNGSGVETKVELMAAPCDLEITEIVARRAGASADVATATLVADVGGSDANPITATAIDIDGLTDDTTTDVPLSATAANYQMKKGELLKCTWLTDSAGTITDAVVVVRYRKLRAGQL